MKKTLLVAVMTAIAGIALAGSAIAEESLNYTYGEVNYIDISLDDDDGLFGGDIDGDGFGVQGAFAITNRIHAYLEYQAQDFDFDIGIDSWEAGVGLNWPISPTVDLIGRAAYAKFESDIDGDELFDESGFALQAGARALLAEKFELEGLVHHVDLGDDIDGTTYRVTGRYNFTDMFTGTLGAELDSETTIWMAGFRFNIAR